MRGAGEVDLLTDEGSRVGLPLHAEYIAAHDGLEGLGAERDGDAGHSVHAEVRDGDESIGTQLGASSCCYIYWSWSCG